MQLLHGKLVSKRPATFVYKVRTVESPEGGNLEAPDGGAGLEISVGSLLFVSVPLCPFTFTSCQSRLTKQIQAKFCYYQ